MKASLLLVALFLGISLAGFSQTNPTDFYAGKWEIMIRNSPRGDIKYLTDLVRKEGKLTGELVGEEDDKRPITKIEESDKTLKVYFMSSQGGEISIDFEKVDDNILRGLIMGYEATAARIIK
jgi:hypothetical protein